jgi:ADP-ribosyl-[dinitrogen reductase] hydrolase
MRLAPVPMYFAGDEDRAADFSARSCVTTHRAAESLDVARLLGRVLARALPGHDQEALLFGIDTSGLTPAIARIARLDFLGKCEDDIHGSGHVVHCLEAALWSFAGGQRRGGHDLITRTPPAATSEATA